MGKNWLKYLVALSAILIAGSAAYFSVTGLGVLFSGAAVAVMVMAGSLEFAKLVTATYLKQEWDEIKGFNKWYLTISVGILMMITSAGIFGYLSNAFQQQNLQLQQLDREILVHTTKIQQNESQIQQLSTQISEFNSNQGKIIDGGKVNSRLLRSIDNRDKQISKLNDKIAKLQEDNALENDAINKIKTDNLGLEKEVGGFRFVAEAFGVELNSVVKFFIILIVIVFDPLAVALVISFNQLVMVKKKDEEVESNPEDLKNFVDETAKIHLTDDDLKKLEEVLLNPQAPNEALQKAADDHKKRGEILSEMMKQDQELGLYDEPFDNPLIKNREEYLTETFPLNDGTTYIQSLDKHNKKEEDKDWENFQQNWIKETEEDLGISSTIVPTEEDEDVNFSTIEPISENIFQEDLIDEALAEHNLHEMLSEFESETFNQNPTNLNEEEPTVNVEEIDNTLNEVNKEIDNEVKVDTSSKQDDEKKNY